MAIFCSLEVKHHREEIDDKIFRNLILVHQNFLMSVYLHDIPLDEAKASFQTALEDAGCCLDEVQRLGPSRLEEFDSALIPRIEMRNHT